MSSVRRGVIALAAMVAVLGLLFYGAGRGLAQDTATPVAETPMVETPAGRPAHIHAGSCDTLDSNPLFPLNDVVAPTGATGGATAATAVEISFSTVPVDLATLLATDNAINVHLSQTEAATYIACGEIGGSAINESGALAVGLREQNDSGFSGVAYLAPNASDPGQTDVSIFLAEGLSEDAEDDGEALDTDDADDAEDSEDADDEEADDSAMGDEAVEVSLTEFAIDMPTTLTAGPTTFTITNDGEFPHSFEIEGQGIEEELPADLEPGESGTLTVDLEPGTYEVYCPVGNHADQGMTLELTVE